MDLNLQRTGHIYPSGRAFIFLTLMALLGRGLNCVAASTPVAAATPKMAHVDIPTTLATVANDPRFHLVLHPQTIIMSGDGRQPYLFASSQGTLFCQAQLSLPPFNSKNKQVYHTRIGSAMSRDGGATWTPWTYQKDHDDVFIEGGMVQLSDGTILMLDTFAMPAAKAGHGVGEIWKSHDDLRSLEGPFDADFTLPAVNWAGSTNDFGKAEASARLHRSIIEMPNRDLLALIYTRFVGDSAPSSYMPTMLKSRVIVVRSHDHGATWSYLSTVGVDAGVGTEGFGEPVFTRVAGGPHSGRLICLMRTGRDLYGSRSDDDGVTWTRPAVERIPGIDIYATEKWERMFSDPKAPDYVTTDDMIGAAVDPDLITMKNGTLVCAVGIRIPARRYKDNWRVPQNGNYLAFSCDGGDTWSHVVQFRSGAPTTNYTGVREFKPGVLYVVYDDSVWNMHGNAVGFQLEVNRSDLSSTGN